MAVALGLLVALSYGTSGRHASGRAIGLAVALVGLVLIAVR